MGEGGELFLGQSQILRGLSTQIWRTFGKILYCSNTRMFYSRKKLILKDFI